MVIVETERLILRRLRTSDSEALNHVFGDEEVMRSGDGVQTAQWVEDWLSRCIEGYERNSGIGPWAVVERESRRTIGYCGLFHFPDVCGRPETEIGYRLARRHWGRGYATEAVRAVRDYAFRTLGIPRLVAIIEPVNAASIRVAKKAGMQYEQEVMLEGYTHPDHVYAIEAGVISEASTPWAGKRAGKPNSRRDPR